ncbi:tRNA (adenine(22)-N(1))-methyltransferase [Streptococcus iniae]|uniref:SAM-dependent methyltransferase n=2 Tax=Streptococcus TaxID=1301 RepID=A0A3L8GHR8_STRIN|nr:tRNA (adenine(22)-N(1))-methyltransferase TrmK [Streptococcus iniae]AGM98539.1 hypothetical protein K710_0762 [Streptococcus iniae SF1]AHY15571.1 SAM-dependent methyltransferase [Streptococcus iniae]AHY17439.1 SAM-dependent methyltransferase [Streptococcus iniae]AJG25746.1 SAM-dependent methyltransferase [Streptococcus iniae]APD31618.1 tRNA (adenine-N(1))-methyltransferase [Streptococcus iniae]
MEINLSQRLRNVAHFVPNGSKLLDVGSDHAYLPIFLLENGKISSAIAGEVVKGPFESALKNVSEYGLAQKIEVRLANGLAAFEPSDQIKVITICGMGGRLIADILEAGKEKLTTVERLILQPNNREDDLRSWLQTNHFQIVAESILAENDKYYEIIVAEHGQQVMAAKELRFGPILGLEKTQIFKEKWSREFDKLEYALSCIPEDNLLDRSAIKQKMQTIKEAISDEGK